MIRFYYHPRSTFSRRVHMVLLEKEIPFEPVVLDMAKRAHKEPEYLALNPYGRVPTLVEDDFVLHESTAIVDYLEATHPEPPLVPPDARGRALVRMHMLLADLELGTATGPLLFPRRFLPKERWDLEAMNRARIGIQRQLGVLEQQLGDKVWLLGANYTLADVAYTPFAEFFPIMGVDVPAAVTFWAARLLARPSAQKTKPDV